MDENDPSRLPPPATQPSEPLVVPSPPPPSQYAPTKLEIDSQSRRPSILLWVLVTAVAVVMGCIVLAVLYNVLVIQPQQREMDDMFSRIGSALGSP